MVRAMRRMLMPVHIVEPVRAAGLIGMGRIAPLVLLLVLPIGEVGGHASRAAPPVSLPERLESYLATTVRPTREERDHLLAGGPITKFLEADPSHEVAVFGAIWIDAPMRRYAEAVIDIETLERGGAFLVTRRIHMPPSLQDFADLQLPAADVAELEHCRVGDCQLKLGSEAIELLRTGIDWSGPSPKPDADALFRAFTHEYLIAYYERGNAALAVYRDKSRPVSVAAEFATIVDRMPPLTHRLAEVRRYLLEYPDFTLPASTDVFYWQETRFGLKPTIRVNHLVVHEGVDEIVVASKMLYASHYFRAALELRVLMPDARRGPGCWFVTVNRSRVDGLSGFGRLVRGRVRGEVQKGTLAALMSTKRRLEPPPP